MSLFKNLKKRAQHIQKKKAIAEKSKESHVSSVMKSTGWDHHEAIQKMDQDWYRYGIYHDQYDQCCGWTLADDLKASLFSRRDSDQLRAKYNTNRFTLHELNHKELFYKKFSDYLGRPWLATKGLSFTEFCHTFKDVPKLLYKPSISYAGKGAHVFSQDKLCLSGIYAALMSLDDGVVEAFLEQHPDAAKFSPNSVNTLRFVTVRTAKHVHDVEAETTHFLYAGVHMTPVRDYPNRSHSKGLYAGVDLKTGKIITDGVSANLKKASKDPGTGTAFKGFEIPFFFEAMKLIEEAGEKVYGYLGWDIAITPNGPALIEINTRPSIDYLQTPYFPEGRGMKYVVAPYL